MEECGFHPKKSWFKEVIQGIRIYHANGNLLFRAAFEYRIFFVEISSSCHISGIIEATEGSILKKGKHSISGGIASGAPVKIVKDSKISDLTAKDLAELQMKDLEKFLLGKENKTANNIKAVENETLTFEKLDDLLKTMDVIEPKGFNSFDKFKVFKGFKF
jgi:hypothetical protein